MYKSPVLWVIRPTIKEHNTIKYSSNKQIDAKKTQGALYLELLLWNCNEILIINRPRRHYTFKYFTTDIE